MLLNSYGPDQEDKPIGNRRSQRIGFPIIVARSRPVDFVAGRGGVGRGRALCCSIIEPVNGL